MESLNSLRVLFHRNGVDTICHEIVNQLATDETSYAATSHEAATASASSGHAPALMIDGSTINLQADQSLCMNAAGGQLQSGDQIILWQCTAAPNEVFVYDSVDKTIRPVQQPDLCMNAWGGRMASGDRIKLYSCSAARNEQWDITADGTFRLHSDPSLCINAWGGQLTVGDELALYPCSTAPNEVFFSSEIQTTINLAADASLCMNAFGGRLQSGDQIGLYPCTAAPNEIWKYGSDGTIRPGSNADLCMNAWGGTMQRGDLVKLYPCSAARNEQWDIGDDNTIRLRSDPSLCMNAFGGQLQSGDQIGLWTCSAARNEVWASSVVQSATHVAAGSGHRRAQQHVGGILAEAKIAPFHPDAVRPHTYRGIPMSVWSAYLAHFVYAASQTAEGSKLLVEFTQAQQMEEELAGGNH